MITKEQIESTGFKYCNKDPNYMIITHTGDTEEEIKLDRYIYYDNQESNHIPSFGEDIYELYIFENEYDKENTKIENIVNRWDCDLNFSNYCEGGCNTWNGGFYIRNLEDFKTILKLIRFPEYIDKYVKEDITTN